MHKTKKIVGWQKVPTKKNRIQGPVFLQTHSNGTLLGPYFGFKLTNIHKNEQVILYQLYRKRSYQDFLILRFCFHRQPLLLQITSKNLNWVKRRAIKHVLLKPFHVEAATNSVPSQDTLSTNENCPGWLDMQTILYTINCNTKKQPMVMSLASCFFYGHSIESLSAINLYGQLMILMFFFYGHPMILMSFLKFLFRQTISSFLFT